MGPPTPPLNKWMQNFFWSKPCIREEAGDVAGSWPSFLFPVPAMASTIGPERGPPSVPLPAPPS